MSIMLSLFLLLLIFYLDACAKDDARQRRIARKRHQEKMKMLQEIKKQKTKKSKVIRTIAKDEKGRTVIQEIREEGEEGVEDDD